MTVAELLNDFALKAGIAPENETLKKIVIGLPSIDVPDDLSAQLQTNLFNEAAAKNSPILQKHFHAQLYNGFDKTLKGSLVELGWTEDEIKNLYEGEVGTSKAVAAALKLVKQKEAERVKAPGKEGDQLTLEINNLKAQIASAANSFTEKEEGLKNSHLEEIQGLLLNNHLSGYKYVLPTSTEANLLTAKSILQKELEDAGAKFKVENHQLKVVTKEGTDYYKNSKQVLAKDFIDEVVAKHKLIQTSEGGTGSEKTGSTVTIERGRPSVHAQATAVLEEFRAANA